MPFRLVMLVLPLPLLVAGCGNEPNFDKRYQDQDAKLRSAANSMQNELSSRLSAAEAARGAGSNETQPANMMTSR